MDVGIFSKLDLTGAISKEMINLSSILLSLQKL
ncbi:hypothetical protein NC652_027776 [Populus alba x Populus x berolinensis]|nr:hypothetical protein NC652_027776 [Populus alba x Populus x berolinensis]